MNYETLDNWLGTRRKRELDAARDTARAEQKQARIEQKTQERIAKSAYHPLIRHNRALVEQAEAINNLWHENGYFTYRHTSGYVQHSSVRVGPTLILEKNPGHNLVANPILRWEEWKGRNDLTAELAFSLIIDDSLGALVADPLKFLHVFDDDNPDSKREESFSIGFNNASNDRLYELASHRAPRFKFSPGLREAIDMTKISRRLISLEQSMHLISSAVLDEKLNPFWADRAKEAGANAAILGDQGLLATEAVASRSSFTKEEYMEAARACLAAGETHLVKNFVDLGLVRTEDLN